MTRGHQEIAEKYLSGLSEREGYELILFALAEINKRHRLERHETSKRIIRACQTALREIDSLGQREGQGCQDSQVEQLAPLDVVGKDAKSASDGTHQEVGKGEVLEGEL